LNTPAIRAVRREFSKQLSKAPAKLIIQIAQGLTGDSDIMHRFFAYELILLHKQALASLNTTILLELGQGLNTWGAVDTFACYLAGPVWRQGQISDALIKRWARSPDRWWRRAAVVSTVPLNNTARGGIGDTARTLMICEMLVGDRDDMVVKALSWALRELTKRDPRSVRQFLLKHANELSPRVVKEVKNKLETGLKNPRKAKLS
jgi:3-methyladenine DNA glycosylase AlkD